MSATILLGAMLTFADADASALQLTVSLTRSATCSVDWDGRTHTATAAATRHVFRPLARPHGRPLTYTLAIAGEPPARIEVTALSDPRPDHLRVALYGDTRGGEAPHRKLVEAMEAQHVDLVINTGDVITRPGDQEGWVRHLAATLPLAARTPVVFALGNHEIYSSHGVRSESGLEEAMRQIPPPLDPLARAAGAPSAAYHVRIGPLLVVSLDSNAPLDPGSGQRRFLEEVLGARQDARFVFWAMHHGPRSSGPHGRHPEAEGLVALAERAHVTAVLAGHDHIYERIVENGVTYLVSGGGGAPLYQRSGFEPGSRAFASTYNWVLLTIDGERLGVEAYSLEGALLDRAAIAPMAESRAGQDAAPGSPWRIYAAAALLVVGLLAVARRLAAA